MTQANHIFPKVAVIIVSLNGKGLLQISLASLKKLNYPSEKLKVILVDNGSKDGSVAWLKKNYPDVLVIKNKVNLGFAKANNQGIKAALKDKKVSFIVTLNNDAEVQRRWLKNLVSFMQNHKRVGIGASKMLQFKNRDRFDSAGDFFLKGSLRVINRGYSQADRGQFDRPQETLSACAAAAIFRRQTLNDIKIFGEFFDEDFVSYIEDTDLNIRAKLKGWLTYYIPDAVIYHMSSATSSKLSKKFKEYVSRRNRILMAVKNFPAPQMILLLAKYILPTTKGASYYLAQKAGRIAKRGLGHYTKKGPVFYFKLFIDRFIITSNPQRLTVLEAMFVHLNAIVAAINILPKIIKKRKIIQRGKKATDPEIARWLTRFVIS